MLTALVIILAVFVLLIGALAFGMCRVAAEADDFDGDWRQ